MKNCERRAKVLYMYAELVLADTKHADVIWNAG